MKCKIIICSERVLERKLNEFLSTEKVAEIVSLEQQVVEPFDPAISKKVRVTILYQ